MKNKDTIVLKIDNKSPEKDKIKRAADVLRNNGLVTFPTETVYGLGANALSEEAVKGIFTAKGRPGDNPLIVHISHTEMLKELVTDIPSKAYELMDKFWPGPLTILFYKKDIIPDIVTARLSTVGIRMPDHKIALDLIKETGLPIAAPSSNTSGKPSPTESEHVIEDIFGKVDIIIDGGPTGVGVESTFLDITSEIPTILRPGGVTHEDLLTVYDEVRYDPALENENLTPKSPGMKYTHYSPKADVKIIKGDLTKIPSKIKELYENYSSKNIKVGIIATEQTINEYNDYIKIVIGDRNNPKTIAANLFKTLREFDKLGVEIILAEGIDEIGIGKAVMNRMEKAAGHDVTVVIGN